MKRHTVCVCFLEVSWITGKGGWPDRYCRVSFRGKVEKLQIVVLQDIQFIVRSYGKLLSRQMVMHPVAEDRSWGDSVA